MHITELEKIAKVEITLHLDSDKEILLNLEEQIWNKFDHMLEEFQEMELINITRENNLLILNLCMR